LFDKDGNEKATAAIAPGGDAFLVRLGPSPATS
jgi:hypothetical protein